jgi:hypothetical protein
MERTEREMVRIEKTRLRHQISASKFRFYGEDWGGDKSYPQNKTVGINVSKIW